MKYVKMLGLAAIATMAVIALSAPSASATTLTCSGGTHCPTGTTFHAEDEGTIVLHPPVGTIECSVFTFRGTTTSTGGSSQTVTADLEGTFTGCNATVHVIKFGTFEFHGSGNNNGTLTSNGLTITIEYGGFHCNFLTQNTDVGTVTGSATTGGAATLDVEAVIPREGGKSGAFCGPDLEWTGAYKFTSPNPLNVD